MKTVDSCRFLDFITRKLVQSWIAMEKPREIPWTPLAKPLSESIVALISTGGIALKTDAPFDLEGERRNPWWGDSSYRVIPKTATAKDVGIYHLHIDTHFAAEDLNCLLPLERLAELEASRQIGRVAKLHYSFMGYILKPQELLERSVPAIIRGLRDDAVDVVVLVPA